MCRVRSTQGGEEEGVYDYIGKGQEKKERPLGRPRRRWVDNIKICLREVGWGSMDLAQDTDQ
jgi:hypothetical protein